MCVLEPRLPTHALMESQGFLFCRRCGAFSQTRTRRLKHICPGKPWSDGKLVIARLLASRNPYNGEQFVWDELVLQHCWFASRVSEAYWQAPIAKFNFRCRRNPVHSGAALQSATSLGGAVSRAVLASTTPSEVAVGQTRALIAQLAAQEVEKRRLRLSVPVSGLALAEGEEDLDPEA